MVEKFIEEKEVQMRKVLSIMVVIFITTLPLESFSQEGRDSSNGQTTQIQAKQNEANACLVQKPIDAYGAYMPAGMALNPCKQASVGVPLQAEVVECFQWFQGNCEKVK